MMEFLRRLGFERRNGTHTSIAEHFGEPASEASRIMDSSVHAAEPMPPVPVLTGAVQLPIPEQAHTTPQRAKRSRARSPRSPRNIQMSNAAAESTTDNNLVADAAAIDLMTNGAFPLTADELAVFAEPINDHVIVANGNGHFSESTELDSPAAQTEIEAPPVTIVMDAPVIETPAVEALQRAPRAKRVRKPKVMQTPEIPHPSYEVVAPKKLVTPVEQSRLSIIIKSMERDTYTIDIGTSTSVVSANGCPVFRAPTAVLIDYTESDKGRMIFGAEALESKDSKNGKQVYFEPLEFGTIKNSDILGAYIQWILGEVLRINKITSWGKNRVMGPRVIVGIHTQITQDHKHNIKTCLQKAVKAHEVIMIDQAMAAAIGSGADVTSSEGCMVVDGGAGTFLVVAISRRGFVHNGYKYLRIGGNTLDEKIIKQIKKDFHGLTIGPKKATQLKERWGTAIEPTGAYADEGEIIRGVNTSDAVKFTRRHAFNAMTGTLGELTSDGILEVLNNIEPGQADALYGDYGNSWLTGGLALMPNLPERIRQEARGLRIRAAEDPLFAVMRGLDEASRSQALLQYIRVND